MEKILLTAFKGLHHSWDVSVGHGIDEIIYSEHKCHAILQTYWVCDHLLSAGLIHPHLFFYYHRFRVDPCSPNYIQEKGSESPDNESDEDYEILSKIIQ